MQTKSLFRLSIPGLFISLCIFIHAGVTIESPDGRISARIFTAEDGGIKYKVEKDGGTVAGPANMGIVIGEKRYWTNVELGETLVRAGREVYERFGVHSKATNSYTGAVLSLISGSKQLPVSIEARVFNDGFAFRYLFIDWMQGKKVSGELTDFTLPPGTRLWFQTNILNYEGLYLERDVDDVESDYYIGPPLVGVLPGDLGYLLITEAALYDYSGMVLKSAGMRTFKAAFTDDDTWPVPASGRSSWRVVLLAPNLDGLVNSDIVANLCLASKIPDDADWVKPGRATWSWWSEGTGDFELNKEYIDAAAELDFEYTLVDAGWEDWSRGDKDGWALIAELVDYARTKDVGVWVWKRCSEIYDRATRLDFLDKCKEAGIVGVKIDFMDSESHEMLRFYTHALEDTAQRGLMVNFHGANKPTGESRTWPHQLTREGIRGLEYNKWSELPPEYYTVIPFTRFVAGPGDFTPCTFREDKLMGTTRSFQLATAIVFTSPMMHWADSPGLYLQSPVRDLISEIPAVWDETRVLPGSEIGDVAAFARRKNDVWFVGVLSARECESYEIDLSFLSDGDYTCMEVRDDADAGNDLTRSVKDVDAGDRISLRLREGGGYVAMFTPKHDE
ncbi:MAG: glycoside hydrolase family 97 protein [Verrucomicrobia bacterium]|nr:glycoside hydrolase family 97 protein [Verrucomicrobiota bacterium]